MTYDEKYIDIDIFWLDSFPRTLGPNKHGGDLMQADYQGGNSWGPEPNSEYIFADPRTSRFGAPSEQGRAVGDNKRGQVPIASSKPSIWLDASNNIFATDRPESESGFGRIFARYSSDKADRTADWGSFAGDGWHVKNIYGTTSSANAIYFQTGLLAQNNPNYEPDKLRFSGDSGAPGSGEAQFYSDPDGVVRRAMGAYVESSVIGQPLATASNISGGVSTAKPQSASRPIILNRPFGSVAELGYVFSDRPWRNLDFFTVESGDTALLDIFTCDESPSDGSLVAGKVNLNTRQLPVLKAIVAGAYRDEANPATGAFSDTEAEEVLSKLITRTSATPLQNLGNLVGKWDSKKTISGSFTPALNTNHNIDGSESYDGFSNDLDVSDVSQKNIQRYREAAIRALASSGQTRVWNLLIDVVAQSGRFSPAASGLDKFAVEGEQRYWVHVAIDRFTGKVLDKQIEVVKE
ncbi:MAG: hypothetical protein ACK5LK_04950 [Chthoniobacterales bacterium]